MNNLFISTVIFALVYKDSKVCLGANCMIIYRFGAGGGAEFCSVWFYPSNEQLVYINCYFCFSLHRFEGMFRR